MDILPRRTARTVSRSNKFCGSTDINSSRQSDAPACASRSAQLPKSVPRTVMHAKSHLGGIAVKRRAEVQCQSYIRCMP